MSTLNKSNTEIIIGNPGCGKTTELISRVSALLESGVKPSEIAYCSFSVVAVEEAIKRATVKCELKRDDFPFFRTLHSMAFQMLGLNTQQTMQDYHLREFGTIANMSFTSVDKTKAKTTTFATKDDKLLQIINVARLYDKPIRDYMIESGCEEFHVAKVEEVAELYKRFKLAKGIFDYTDMLLLAKVTEMDIPDLKYLFVDEAQDLSTLQWMLVERMAESSENIVISGDDKQSINSFAGADVDYFLSIDGRVTVLEQSYRVPESVFKLANRIVTKMSKYREEGTQWTHRGEEGFVKYVTSLPYQDMTRGNWMILARTNGQLNDIKMELLRNAGEFAPMFTMNDQPPIDLDVFRAIKLFEMEETPSGRTKFDLVQFYETDTDEERKKKLEYIQLFKKFIDCSNGNNKQFLQPWEITDNFKRSFSQTNWLNAFNKLGIGERKYISYLRTRFEEHGADIFKKVPIQLITVHAAKGTEADNVIVLTNVPRSVSNAMQEQDNDTEVKVFYVAVTRAKKKLYLLTQDERKVNYKTYL